MTILGIMEEPESFDDLLRPDEMALRFTPLGFSTGGLVMSPEGGLGYLKDGIASAELVPEVPVEVRQHFARLRKLYLYGLLEYDLFTLVEDLAHLVLEAAFRLRFVSYYEGRVPIVVKNGKNTASATLLASSFDAVRTAVRRGWRLDVGGNRELLPLDLTRLLEWARRERLVVGQRSRTLEEDMAEARNDAAHPVRYSVDMPLSVGRSLSDVAEIINKLWGSDTQGGRLFPGPVARVPRVIALAPSGLSSVEFPSLLSVREDDPKYRDWNYSLFLATPNEQLVELHSGGPRATHQAGFQNTMYPCDLLWGPGPREELADELDRLEDVSLCDEVKYLDRVFVIRVDGERSDDARSPEEFNVSTEQNGVWHVTRADHPRTAWCHIRDKHAQDIARSQPVACLDCAVTDIGRFGSREETTHCLQRL